MNLVLSDLYAVLIALPVFAAIAAIAIYVEWRNRGVSGLLSGQEWLLAAKIAAIPLIMMILVQAKISLDLPAEMFLYGRF